MTRSSLTRRHLLAASGAALLMPATVRAAETKPGVRHNISGFSHQDWRDHFSELGVGAIVCDTNSRALHYWSGNEYRIYPTSVPKTDELTRRGYSKIVRKKVGPSWTPTASQMERFPDWKPVAGGAPDNPLGSHAMYLDWPAYLIHGTHDTRKIGRRSSDGCIGLYNPKIEELYAMTAIGTQVRLV
ncbi:L,D-transpeptidase [Marinovum sp. 2_MG-2023]|uniref:L,D-transpeptidase n=1 Tax=Roseobacteraceae TaxID=2854170 RepID=UPI001FD1F717|nr:MULTISPECIES: L,D-transpeptidase [Roseobacteraceae]MCJ7873029.1 L,D-transpeptidase [Phaeobacter sp. J2-8]MDO6730865.1 L,D-transpeptidase [Marinovum sp. 2_MG-2023]MDO6779930.1 L,D-transpeptidase [Marinovum sp. 1_MG-2023]